ncbi:MAG: patatin-like phospholipase family protein [Endomicrobium sp.]|jgi:patatin-like phospholipase/acyl hydrolase|nr:patatin-like phospholipase family protein [Endomicrobium sp.]
MAPEKRKEIKILSIDGGGIRGVIPAMFLASVEEKLNGKNIYEYFDIICGTNAGVIVALSASAGIKMNLLIELYKENRKEIFRKGFLRKIKNIFCHNSLYNSKVLYEKLANIFEDKKISDLKTKILIPSSIVNTRQTKILKTPHTVVYPNKETFFADKEYMLRDVALATSAAPFFFTPHKIENYYYWDGGLWANNPTICGLIEAKRLDKDVKVKILSLGTGYYKLNVLNRSLECFSRIKTLFNPKFD